MYLPTFINFFFFFFFFADLNSPFLCDIVFDLFHILNKSDNNNNLAFI